MPTPRIQDEVAPKGNIDVFHLLDNRLWLKLMFSLQKTPHYTLICETCKGLVAFSFSKEITPFS